VGLLGYVRMIEAGRGERYLAANWRGATVGCRAIDGGVKKIMEIMIKNMIITAMNEVMKMMIKLKKKEMIM
jgi:Fe-S cluster biogenesis protein NfuA